MSKRTVEHKPTSRQALLWLILLLFLPFTYTFRHKIEAFFYKKSQCQEPRRRTWRSYAVPLPVGYGAYGIDVSHYSCNIDWAGVAEMNERGVKVNFAFMRATRGTDFLDFQFSENWEGAKSARILRGCYHFFKFGENPYDQAAFFLKNVSFEKGDLPPVLDIENDKETDDAAMSQEKIQENIAIWLITVERATGLKPIIYANLDYYKRYISGKFPNHKIWIAHYDSQKNVRLPDGRIWSFWQTSDKARCNGISEKIDFNVFNGSEAELWGLVKI